MRVGYLPDMFGHVAQMPQILRLAGIDTAVVWRGVPGAIDRTRSRGRRRTARPFEPSTSRTGTGTARTCSTCRASSAASSTPSRSRTARSSATSRSSRCSATTTWSRMPQLTDLMEESGAAAQVSTLPDYLATVDGRRSCRRWQGELRSGARANMLMGDASARLDLKAAMARGRAGSRRAMRSRSRRCTEPRGRIGCSISPGGG